MKRIVYALLCLIPVLLFSQIKKPLDHSVYAGWKDLSQPQISKDGKWISYEINPQKGDGWLYLIESDTKKKESFFKSRNAQFSPASTYIAFRFGLDFDSARALKLAKKKPDDIPKDTLMVLRFNDHKSKKFPNIKSFKVPADESNWMVILFDKEAKKEKSAKETGSIKDSTKIQKDIVKETKDTIKSQKDIAKDIKDTSKTKKDTTKLKKEGTEFLIYNPVNEKEFRFLNISDYNISKNGSLIAFTSAVKDSVDTCMVFIFDTQKEKSERIFYMSGFVKSLSIDEKGDQLAFLYSKDTGTVKVYNLAYWNKKTGSVVYIVDTMNNALPKGYSVSENSTPWFSQNGQKLYFGTAEKPVQEPKDTLLPEEKATFDLWSWTDPFLQSHQLKDLPIDKKRSYLAVYHFDKKKMVQLADETMPSVSTLMKGNLDIGLGSSDIPYRKLVSWDQRYIDMYYLDLISGKRKLLLEKNASAARLSVTGKYLIWYDIKDSSWYSMNIEKGGKQNLTKPTLACYYNKLNDVPDDPAPLGLAGFTKNDNEVLIYDDYEIWMFDLTGKNKPVNLTDGFGKKNKIQLRYIRLDKDEEFIDLEKPILLKGFNEITKDESFWTLRVKENRIPVKLVEENFRFTNPVKAENADKLIWQKGNFQKCPELYVSDMDFKNSSEISETNPQQKDYLWGSVELVKWTASNGKELEGLLYKPENFDPLKKYPMIVYFYERTSDYLNAHYTPSPSRSVINIPYFISNGYIVFVPDITYTIGYPGQSAYEAIVSGSLAMVEKGFIDRTKIGIQGQSWGGYQVAYLITRTNMFAAAGAGAAVSNMTSAYGGIRWQSGMSRMFQYEKSQSRMGATLWERPLRFIENSPLFFADKVNTPVFMMNNDNDGAVPWYQGIEFFTSLRRLDKPVWMINYNGDEHNLKRENWGNRVDLSIRLAQFFDHYLKGKPMPKWMKEGIPAIKKGKEFGYEE